MRRLVTASALFGCLLAALSAGSAQAASSSTDTVVFKGSGTYHVRLVLRSGESFDVRASFNFKTVFLNAFFVSDYSGRALSSIRNSSYGGSWKASATMPGQPAACSQSGLFATASDSKSPAPLNYSWNANIVAFHVYALPSERMTPRKSVADDCYGDLGTGAGATVHADFWRDWVLSFSKLGGSSHDLLSARFKRPASALSAKQATETLLPPTSQQLPAFCHTHSYTSCKQSYHWNGTVTFTHRP